MYKRLYQSHLSSDIDDTMNGIMSQIRSFKKLDDKSLSEFRVILQKTILFIRGETNHAAVIIKSQMNNFETNYGYRQFICRVSFITDPLVEDDVCIQFYNEYDMEGIYVTASSTISSLIPSMLLPKFIKKRIVRENYVIGLAIFEIVD